MTTKLTVIVDNIPDKGLKGEWGLSILAEHNGKMILADAGGSSLFAENLEKLGFDIEKIGYATLSHAHYDHANGIPEFFAKNSSAKFYIRENSGEDCYSEKFFFKKKYIGMPKNVLSDYSDRIETVSGDYMLYEGAYLIPHKTAGLSAIGKRERMFRLTNNGFIPDDFSHEQSLVLDTEKGMVIINCCSHGGAVNIINEIKKTFPDKHIYGLIGGFHLFNKTNSEIRRVAREIRSTGIDFVCTGHCTGDRAFRIMKKELGENICQLHVGLEMEF